ncbi:MAG TPA: calcium-binding protein [Tepidisphaeraceae bacterium]|jgi:hypothetical protein
MNQNQTKRNEKVSVEALERRQLMSISLNSGVVSVTGSSAFDHVMVSLVPHNSKQVRVNLNGFAQAFGISDIKGIKINTGSGIDHIVVDETFGRVTVPMTINGGGGADYIVSGTGNDSINGGGGKDRINSGAGDDLVSGGASRDLIAGGAGNDTISGGTGDDAINAGDGNDIASGGTGDDVITGDAGLDWITGGSDSDDLSGGLGADTILGGRGDDELDGGASADSLTGGTGADAFAGDSVSTDTIVDKTSGSDRVYTPFSLEQIPQHYRDLFNATFHNSVPLGVQVNDDQTFTMLYQYNGDGSTYHAYFTYTGNDPFANLDGVELVKYELPVANIPPEMLLHMQKAWGNANIKEVYADHDEQGKFAMFRIKQGDQESQWVYLSWMGND